MKVPATAITLVMVCLLLSIGTTAEAAMMEFQIGNHLSAPEDYYSASAPYTGDGFFSTRVWQQYDQATSQWAYSYTYMPYFEARELHYYSGSGNRYINHQYIETQLQANISALSGLNITSASLSFNFNHQYDGYGSDIDLLFTSFDSNGTLGWYNSQYNVGGAPVAALGNVGLSFAETDYGVHSIDVTTLVQDRIDGGEDYFAMLMETTSESNYEYTYQYPAESSDVVLTVHYEETVPEPATMVALGCLGAGMIGARRMRRRKH